ncbi:DUF1364 domain-containing protein [Pelagibacterium sp. 26DY04]|uniref:nuclease domain-containing protein n=1 Tax=Pelagibacterium sp. 26DY04 TaxID=2967130 RepID=UPI002815F83A|nr:nuclease domain-containing protein [Pelagibacterium sp. 26DY04]WMT88235.1 DUF1364 domain-containing protein [Pelagibacterium sp. 26DY04]
MIRSRKILRHAKGQPCQLRLPGICNGNPETTVWCHLNGHGKGMGLKTHDVLGFFGCSNCHAAYDQGKGRAELIPSVLDAVCASWVVLIRDGIIFVPQDAENPSHERPVKPRKPRGERAPIQSRTEWPSGRKMQSRPFPKRAAQEQS